MFSPHTPGVDLPSTPRGAGGDSPGLSFLAPPATSSAQPGGGASDTAEVKQNVESLPPPSPSSTARGGERVPDTSTVSSEVHNGGLSTVEEGGPGGAPTTPGPSPHTPASAPVVDYRRLLREEGAGAELPDHLHALAVRAGLGDALAPKEGDEATTVRLVMSELVRRTDALKVAGAEIIKLRRKLAETVKDAAREREEAFTSNRARTEAEGAVVRATLGDVVAAADAARSSGFATVRSGADVLTATSDALLAQMRAGESSGGGGGEATLLRVVRRLVVLAARFSAMASENGQLVTSVRQLKAQLSVATAAMQSSVSTRPKPTISTPVDSLDRLSTSQALSAHAGLHGLSTALVNAVDTDVGGGVRASSTAYTSAVLSGAGGLDASAPVSSLAHARLLDAYTDAQGQVEELRLHCASLAQELVDVRDAHGMASRVLADRKAGSDGREGALKDGLAAQQSVVARLEHELDKALSKLAQERRRVREAEAAAASDRSRADSVTAELASLRRDTAREFAGRVAAGTWAGHAGSAMARARAEERSGKPAMSAATSPTSGQSMGEEEGTSSASPPASTTAMLSAQLATIQARVASIEGLGHTQRRGQGSRVGAAVGLGLPPRPEDLEADLEADLLALDTALGLGTGVKAASRPPSGRTALPGVSRAGSARTVHTTSSAQGDAVRVAAGRLDSS